MTKRCTWMIAGALFVLPCSWGRPGRGMHMTAADLVADASWFGQATNGTGIVGHSVVDMHEHLGQSIAYARMNQIVPPWSR